MKYNILNNREEFIEFVMNDIDNTNPRDGKGRPLDGHDEVITLDWLWENYGEYTYATQKTSVETVFIEILHKYNINY